MFSYIYSGLFLYLSLSSFLCDQKEMLHSSIAEASSEMCSSYGHLGKTNTCLCSLMLTYLERDDLAFGFWCHLEKLTIAMYTDACTI